MAELTDLIVTPLREYGRKLYKETGHRVRLEVAIEAELFERLTVELDRPHDLLQPSVVFLENAVQIVVTPKQQLLASQLARREMDARRTGIDVVEAHSIEITGMPMRGTCISCGADLDALARTGVTGHVCFGPDDSTNHREPS